MAAPANRAVEAFVIATVVLSTAGYAATEFLRGATPADHRTDDPASACGTPTPTASAWGSGSLGRRSAGFEPGHAVAVRCVEGDWWLSG